MRYLLWALVLVVTFGLGLAVGGVGWKGSSAKQEVDHERETVSRLQQQVGMLQARLRARENPTARRDASSESPSGTGTWPGERFASAAIMDGMIPDRPARRGSAAPRQGGPAADGVSSRPESGGAAGPAPTVEVAIDRFYQYLEALNGADGRERWQRVRELTEQLRAMGDSGAQALMQVLANGSDSDERRAAARLLGTLQVPQALPLLQNIIEKEDDVLLRRAAAAGLRGLQTPESVPVMERLLANPGEDRFVRLSAAAGLAQSGRPLGVSGLTQIFEESTADGRGREMAFRALNSLNDERSLPFMRQLVTSQAEPAYRLQAIRYLTGQGDRQALGALQVLMQSPNEQPSIRDAATQAHATISRGK
jgi:hypothetical protein